MKPGMSLEALLTEVTRQSGSKRDFVTSTRDAVRMWEKDEKLWIVLLQEGSSELERFGITDNAHQQIAARLGIPFKYYGRLLKDHRDLVVTQVNALFEREPESRMLRALDGNVRAFLSDHYRRIDNDLVLQATLPQIIEQNKTGKITSKMLSSHVSENSMYVKVLFDSPDLEQQIGTGPDGRPDIVRPGLIIENSETGRGASKGTGFFYRDYCLNGCVFGMTEAFAYKRTHLGGKLLPTDSMEIFAADTREKELELVHLEFRDMMTAMSSPEQVQKMGDKLRALKNESAPVQNALAAVDVLVKELDIREGEKDGILESFIKDRDYSQWGMLNAVTQEANRDDVSYERACELEVVGNQVAMMNPVQWLKIANAEKVPA